MCRKESFFLVIQCIKPSYIYHRHGQRQFWGGGAPGKTRPQEKTDPRDSNQQQYYCIQKPIIQLSDLLLCFVHHWLWNTAVGPTAVLLSSVVIFVILLLGQQLRFSNQLLLVYPTAVFLSPMVFCYLLLCFSNQLYSSKAFVYKAFIELSRNYPTATFLAPLVFCYLLLHFLHHWYLI